MNLFTTVIFEVVCFLHFKKAIWLFYFLEERSKCKKIVQDCGFIIDNSYQLISFSLKFNVFFILFVKLLAVLIVYESVNLKWNLIKIADLKKVLKRNVFLIFPYFYKHFNWFWLISLSFSFLNQNVLVFVFSHDALNCLQWYSKVT